jgi:hypothetical protein
MLLRALTIPLLCLAPTWRAPTESDRRWRLFNSLRQPRPTRYAVRCGLPAGITAQDGHYDALVEGEWRRCPITLLNRSDNPTGRAVACWTPRSASCAVRAPES